MEKELFLYTETIKGTFLIYNVDREKFDTAQLCPLNGRKFFMVNGYEPNVQGMLEYANDFKTFCDQMKNDKISIDYKKYYSHYDAVKMIFKRFCKGRYEHHEKISFSEFLWFNKCPNGGQMYCKAGTYQCYGYDMKKFYASILNDENFLIPTKQGKECIIKNISKETLEFGFYRCQIVSNNSDFSKLFMFSADNIYCVYSLIQAFKYQEEFNVSIKMINDGLPNAYIYDSDCLVSASSIFDSWYNKLIQLNDRYPKNKLVKILMTYLWGCLNESNTENWTLEKKNNFKGKIDTTPRNKYMIYEQHFKSSKNMYFEIIDTEQPVKFNIRLKPFITSYGRNIISDIAYKNLEHVVRIQTDNITYDIPINHNIPNFAEEDKTTGYIKFDNVNKYHKLCKCAVILQPIIQSWNKKKWFHKFYFKKIYKL